MLHLEGDVIQHRLVGIRILFDQMIHLKPLQVVRVQSFDHLFSSRRATMDSGQHTMKYIKKITP